MSHSQDTETFLGKPVSRQAYESSQLNMSSQCNRMTNYIRLRPIRQTAGIILHLYGIIDTLLKHHFYPKVYTPRLKSFCKKTRFTKSSMQQNFTKKPESGFYIKGVNGGLQVTARYISYLSS